ncbi:VOC family protein [Sorangium sp. So ce295]|uniref:VOC family protein n=1 Tax=Sorangium sp. So ce295 TaxID=3133295 RepID=UPI003F616D3F
MTASHEPPAPPPVSPYLTVDDARAAIAFYQRAFGATVVAEQPTPDGKKLIHAALLVNGGLVMLSDDFPEQCGGVSRTPKAFGGTAVTLHLDLPDVDATWKSAVEAGASVEMPLADMFWGDRYGIVTDPFGHRWSLATRKKPATQEELDAGAKKQFPAAT